MAVAAEIQVRDKLFIGGEWVDPSGSETIDVVNASTEEVMGRIPQSTPADVDRAVAGRAGRLRVLVADAAGGAREPGARSRRGAGGARRTRSRRRSRRRWACRSG